MARRQENDRKGRPPRRGRERERDDGKERAERDFQREIQMRITYFLDSEEQELELEPMNSFRRREVHTLAKQYNLQSDSVGEDRDRRIRLTKTEETEKKAPERPAPRVRLWDFGNQTFRLQPGKNGVRMALKVDGSVEIWREAESSHIIADRVVESSEFRIRQGRILVPGEAGY